LFLFVLLLFVVFVVFFNCLFGFGCLFVLCSFLQSAIMMEPSGAFNSDMLTNVQCALALESDEAEVICEKYGITITRGMMRRLRLSKAEDDDPVQFYLNDELINLFMGMLSELDTQLCTINLHRVKSHFFLTYFMTKLRIGGFSAIER
jgi:Ulp1 family protease